MFSWLWKRYNDAVFCIGVTGSFLSHPMRFFQETLLIANTIILLGYSISKTHVSIFFVGITLLAVFIGSFLVRLGYVRHQTTLSNRENPLLNEINNRLKRLEKQR